MTEHSEQPSDATQPPDHGSAENLTSTGMAALQGQARDTQLAPKDNYEATMIGTPLQDAEFYRPQEYPGTCAVVAQEGIIAKHTGADPGEDGLREEAIENGWLSNPGTPNEGTPWSAVGNLLEARDLRVARWEEADLDLLSSDIASGHGVIVGVDAGKLWDDPRSDNSGHAVWVTGIEVDSRGRPSAVRINDSGNPEIDGGGRVPIDVFQDAWDAMGRPMVATLEAAGDVRTGAIK